MIPAPKKVTRLTSGQSNQTLRLKSDDSDLVLKRWQNDGLFQVDRGLEVTVQKTLAESGAAPEVLDWNEAEGWLLQPYLEAPSLNQVTLSPAIKATVLAEVLAKIHSFKPSIPHWRLNDKVEHYLQQLSNYEPSLAKSFREEKSQHQQAIDQWLEYPVLCHNDLSMNHILMTAPIKVIDWEYAGIGHPLFDIANTIVMNKLDDAMAERLLTDYARLTRYDVEFADITEWLDLVDWLNNLWQHLLSYSK